MRNRLKEPFLITVFLLVGVCLPALDDPVDFGDGIFDDGTNFPELTGEPPEYTPDGIEKNPETQQPETPKPAEKKPFRVKKRMFEMSIANLGLNFSNDFIAVSDIVRDPFYLLGNINDIVDDPGLIWNDPVVIDMDNFFDGFNFNFGTFIKPLSFNLNWNDQWGVGLDIAHIDITGNLSLSGNLITMSETEKDKFGVGGAVFVDIGVPVFFHYRDFKIKLRPATYVPVVYTEPKVTYSFTDTGNGARYEINYDMKIYSLVSMENIDDVPQNLMDNAWDIPKNFGYDFGLNVEYPLRYNVDVGLNVVNIPFIAAKLNHYMDLSGSVWADFSKIDIADLVAEDEEGNRKNLEDLKGIAYDYPDEFTPEYKYNSAGKKIYRPFAMVLYAQYRPFESHLLTLIPSFGFSINNLYPEIAAIEGGLSARFDLVNMFITTLGINYNDRQWINSVGFIMNFRVFEFDFGVTFQSPDFVRSWQGAGLGVNLGLKFGW